MERAPRGAKRRDVPGSGKAGNADAKTMNSEQWVMTVNRSGGTKTGGHEGIIGCVRTAGLSGECVAVRPWEQQIALWERDAHVHRNVFHRRLLGLRLTDASYTDRPVTTSADR
jgi:hypothetical protein